MSRRRSIQVSYLVIFAVMLLLLLNRNVQSDPESSIVDWQQPVYAKDLRRFELLNRTAVQISQSYIDPTQIHPKNMFLTAIAKLETEVPQFVLHTEGKDEVPRAFQLGKFRQEINDAQFTSIWQTVFHLSDALRMIARSGLIHESQLKKLERHASQGLLSTLDKHSVVLTDGDLFELKQNTLGRFGGIGVVIELSARQLRIREVMPGTPAYRMGLKAGEHIVGIDEDTTENITLGEAAELLRGPVGSTVSLVVSASDGSSRRDVRMTRTKIDVKSVSSQMLKGGIGYLKIAHFQERTTTELQAAYRKWSMKPRGLIIDLRDNPGGLLDQAIAVSDLFLSEGEIVTTVGHQYEPTHTHYASPNSLDLSTPIVILVNGSSASASEIMAAAFQEHGRGIVLGQPSYGKGTVQVLFEYPNETGLKLTVAQYLTPGRKSIQDVGVQPDVLLRSFNPDKTSTTEPNPHFFRKRQTQNQFSIDFLGADSARKTERDIAHLFLLQHLKRNQTSRRPIATPIVSKLKSQYEKALRYAFSKQGLEWQAEQCTTKSAVTIEPIIDQTPTPTSASWIPSVRVSNRGEHSTGSMLLKVRSGEYIHYRHTGGLRPGDQKNISVEKPIPVNRIGTRCLVSFTLMDSCGRVRAERDELVDCQPSTAPSLRSLVHFSDLKQGNRDGVLQAGERGRLLLSLVSTNLPTNQPLHAYLTLMGKPRHRVVRLLNGHASATSAMDGDKLGMTRSQLTSLSFELEGKANDVFSQTTRQSMSITVRDHQGKELLRQLFELPVFPSEPTAAVNRRRMITHSEPMVTLAAQTPLYFQPIESAQIVGMAAGRFRSLSHRGQWHLLTTTHGLAWVKDSGIPHPLSIGGNVSSTQKVEPHFVEGGRITVMGYDEMSKERTVTISGELSGTKLLDYRLFHNGRKKRYRQFDQPHVLARPFSETIELKPGLNRLQLIVRSKTGHQTSQTLLITKK